MSKPMEKPCHLLYTHTNTETLQHLPDTWKSDYKYNFSSLKVGGRLTKAELIASTKLSSSSSSSSSASRWLVDHTRELAVSDSCSAPISNINATDGYLARIKILK